MSPLSFIHESFASRVVFRAGALDVLAEETTRLGKRVLVLSTHGQRGLAERAARLLGSALAGVYDQALMHVPIEVARAARAEATRLEADCCVAIGGGSTVGLAKAIALENEIPILAVATTYAGSEMTPIWGLTEGGVKRTGRDARVRPRTVIYDPLLTLGLPPGISATSGINAMAHCVEGLYSENANPITSLMAEEGIRALARNLPKVVNAPHDLEARSAALYGAWLGGSVLGAVGMALHHRLCHVLGGAFNLPHAETHAVLLPHVLAYNAAAAPEALRRIGTALDMEDPPRGIFELARTLRASTALKDIGMPEEGIERAVALATAKPFYNPAPIRADGIRALLTDAFEGRMP